MNPPTIWWHIDWFCSWKLADGSFGRHRWLRRWPCVTSTLRSWNPRLPPQSWNKGFVEKCIYYEEEDRKQQIRVWNSSLMRRVPSKKHASNIYTTGETQLLLFRKEQKGSRESLKEKAGKKLTEMGANINPLVQAALLHIWPCCVWLSERGLIIWLQLNDCLKIVDNVILEL